MGQRRRTFAGDVLGPGVKGGGQEEDTHQEAHEVQGQHGGDAPKGQALQDSAADAGTIAVVLGGAAVEGRSAQRGQQERQHGYYCLMVLPGRGRVGWLGSPLPTPDCQGGYREGWSVASVGAPREGRCVSHGFISWPSGCDRTLGLASTP